MYCSTCGKQLTPSGSCVNCGSSSSAPSGSYAQQQPPAKASGNTFSILGIVFGGIAFLFLPVILGPAGLVLAIIGKKKNESLAVIAIVVAALGTVLGMLLGAIVFASF